MSTRADDVPQRVVSEAVFASAYAISTFVTEDASGVHVELEKDAAVRGTSS
jgi:hypothetical protein